MVALLFPGQGSQFVGMGHDLVSASPAAREVFEEADSVLGFSLSRLCFEGDDVELTRTSNTQPAILAHSVAVLRSLGDQVGKVALAAGHSLGEFTAYVAAGSLSLADALRTVRRRGELMESSGRERPGTMAAILGLDDASVEKVCRAAAAEGGECVAANFNAPNQVVISGDIPTVERALEIAREAGARRAIRLNVSGAFHSPLMRVAEPGLAAHLDTVTLAPGRFPVVSNVTAKPVQDVVDARRLLLQQLVSPVHWTASIQTMLDAGVNRFLELGPGTVLTGLMKRAGRAVEARAIGTADDLRAFQSA
ncbi:MAG: ACP S-malonyltransferase [Longimicrobiales bacterium]